MRLRSQLVENLEFILAFTNKQELFPSMWSELMATVFPRI